MREKLTQAVAAEIYNRHSNINIRQVKALAPHVVDAVLEAMKEPTEEMLVDAGSMNGFDYDHPRPDDAHVSWWQAMIEAAKEEQNND